MIENSYLKMSSVRALILLDLIIRTHAFNCEYI